MNRSTLSLESELSCPRQITHRGCRLEQRVRIVPHYARGVGESAGDSGVSHLDPLPACPWCPRAEYRDRQLRIGDTVWSSTLIWVNYWRLLPPGGNVDRFLSMELLAVPTICPPILDIGQPVGRPVQLAEWRHCLISVQRAAWNPGNCSIPLRLVGGTGAGSTAACRRTGTPPGLGVLPIGPTAALGRRSRRARPHTLLTG